MSTPNGMDAEERFARAWRDWLDRPVRRSPETAAARVLEVVRDAPRRRRPVFAFAAAVATLALVAVICLFPRRISTELPPTTDRPSVLSDSAQPGEVLIWLDEETPLYMHFQPPASQGGNSL